MICVISIRVEIHGMSSFVSIDIVRLHSLSYMHLIEMMLALCRLWKVHS